MGIAETKQVDNSTTLEEKKVDQSVENTASEPKVEKEVPETPAEETKTKEQSSKEETKEDKEEDKLALKNLDINFARDVLSVPTCSHHEYRMVSFIILWARANKVKYEFDDYGNLYLTKGELEEGEYYPCVTSHLDTVQSQQEAYAQCGVNLQLKERVTTKGHEWYVEDTGIGADDKAGVLISLSLVKHFDKIKACFFLEEEVGCLGSKKLNKKWFENVGYVIGWDSPDRNRAAYACSGELLMSKDFFKKIEETCKEHGVTNFKSEPFTDVKEIRIQTEVMCSNFGNGGYNAHQATEYVVLEDMDGALGLGIALIDLLGFEKFRMPSKNTYYKYGSSLNDEDVKFFDNKDSRSYDYYGGTYRNKSESNTSNSQTSTTQTKTKTVSEENTKLEPQVLDYVVERYEKHILNIQTKCEEREATILKSIKELFKNKEKDVKYEDIVKIFGENYSSEPFSTAIEF